jgi:hypothetical protein
MKKCTSCKIEKEESLDNFRFGKGYKNNLRSSCRVCENESKKVYDERYRNKLESKIKMKDYCREYVKSKKEKNTQYKIKSRITNKIYQAIKGNYKKGQGVNYLGCDIKFYKNYISSMFIKDMSWDNWSIKTWHIDHIKPINSFDLTNEEELKLCFNYKNTRPMFWLENIKKTDK